MLRLLIRAFLTTVWRRDESPGESV